MAEFLTTLQISSFIEDVIMTGKKKITLVSPYLQISRNLFERLTDADKCGVEIVVIYGKDKLHTRERKQLTELKNLRLYFSKNLHAKCYFNEDLLVVTSMNMYEYSEKNNREMGIGIERKSSKQLYEDVTTEVDSIISSADLKHKGRGLDNIEKDTSFFGKLKKLVDIGSSDGYCIRCLETVPYNVNDPLCDKCLTNWNYYKNKSYQEKFCHSCRSKAKTSMASPLCVKCD